MTGKAEGPELVALIARLRETPPEYLLKPRVEVDTAALYCDLVDLSGGIAAADAQAIRDAIDAAAGASPNLGGLVQMAAWLLADPWFQRRGTLSAATPGALCVRFVEMAKLVRLADAFGDEERREEFVRVFLDALALLPKGESEARAKDRLDAIDSAARAAVADAARKAYLRAQEVAREVARAASEAAAAKTSRE